LGNGARKPRLRVGARKPETRELAQGIRSYVRHVHRLSEELRSLDEDGAGYWALEKAVDEGEKVMLYRLMQYLEHYLKEDLPPDLVKA
jgi:hypothetical protein